jgi:hypothetical protein
LFAKKAREQCGLNKNASRKPLHKDQSSLVFLDTMLPVHSFLRRPAVPVRDRADWRGWPSVR